MRLTHERKLHRRVDDEHLLLLRHLRLLRLVNLVRSGRVTGPRQSQRRVTPGTTGWEDGQGAPEETEGPSPTDTGSEISILTPLRDCMYVYV